jgi:hypothetical protein
MCTSINFNGLYIIFLSAFNVPLYLSGYRTTNGKGMIIGKDVSRKDTASL